MTTQKKTHQDFYTHARLYEEAFSGRDIEQECTFMRDTFSHHTGRPLDSMLELASGPATHARWYASQQIKAHALDVSEAMLCHARQQCTSPAHFRTYRADMSDFDLGNVQVDLACCLIDSIAYMTHHDAFRNHLECVARALREQGLYIIETMHPKEALSQIQTTETSWTVACDERCVEVVFGQPDDVMDPVSQVTHTHVTLRERQGDRILIDMAECAPLKTYLYQELLALIHGSRFTVIATHGAMARDVALDDTSRAWRTVLVLQKLPSL